MLARFRDENATVTSGFNVPDAVLVPEAGASGSGRFHQIRLQDGRQLGWAEFGARHGFPILYMHREGSCRLEAEFFDRFARVAGFRLIAVDRPGIGASDYAAMESARQIAREHGQLIQHLGLRRFGLLSWGGGSAFALPLARMEQQSCAFVALLSPVDQPCSMTSNRILRTLFTLGLSAFVSVRRICSGRDLGRYFQRWREQLNGVERRYSDDERVRLLLASISDEALRQGAAGLAQDIWLAAGGSKPAEHGLQIPVHIWSARHRDAEHRHDRLVHHPMRGQNQLIAGYVASQLFEVLRAEQRKPGQP